MHETGIVRDLVRRAEAIAMANGAARVRVVRVRLGALTQISPTHFRDHFADDAAGTLCEGAVLDIAEGTDPADPQALDVVLESVDLED
jgi:hydrogenase nickel incorporation protein HypA/HybF